ncbi:DUF6380 family protein [Streptomyces sp. NPDC058676]
MDIPVQGDAVGEKWHATLRRGTASLTATACRVRITSPGGRSGEGER